MGHEARSKPSMETASILGMLGRADEPEIYNSTLKRVRQICVKRPSMRQRGQRIKLDGSGDMWGQGSIMLSVGLLGPLTVSIGHRQLTGLPKKSQALLAFVAAHKHPVARDRLADLLWPDCTNDVGRHRLRSALLAIRSALHQDAASCIQGSKESVQLNRGSASLDIAVIEDAADSRSIDELRRACSLYRGEFLSDLVSVSPVFDDWAEGRRKFFQESACKVAVRLSEMLSERGDHDEAISSAQKSVDIDKLSEEAHRALIASYSKAGRYTNAFRQYRDCADILKSELGITPSQETRALLERLGPDAGAASGARGVDQPHEVAVQPLPLQPISDKPSIAVLPFAVMNGDTEQEYFADGVVDDIITALGRTKTLFVIARSSSFSYKNRNADAKTIGHELGVKYILSGSIRRHAERIRISAHLVVASTAHQIWSDRFEGSIQDLFDLQDRIAESVVCAIEPEIRSVELSQSRAKRPEDLDAYDLYLQALPSVWMVSRDGNTAARRLLDKAIEKDPRYALAHALQAFCWQQVRQQGWAEDPAIASENGVRAAEHALHLDPDDPRVLWIAGHALTTLGGQHARGRVLIDRSLDLNPNSAQAWCISGWHNVYMAQGQLGIENFERSFRISPRDQFNYYVFAGISAAHLSMKKYHSSIEWARRALDERKSYLPALRFLAVSHAYLGNKSEAGYYVVQMLTVDPSLTVSLVSRARTNQFVESDKAHFLNGLRLAGLRE